MPRAARYVWCMLRRIPARLRRLALIAVLGVVGGVGAPAGMQALGASAVPASPSDFAFDSMDVAYTLGVDDHGRAVLDVTETLIETFPEFD